MILRGTRRLNAGLGCYVIARLYSGIADPSDFACDRFTLVLKPNM